jgi:hypothetical protein
MKRTTIFLPEGLERDLQAEARRRGEPMAALVREALAQYVAGSRPSGSALSFVGCGAAADPHGAERHEQLLWTDPHRASAEPIRRQRRRGRKVR